MNRLRPSCLPIIVGCFCGLSGCGTEAGDRGTPPSYEVSDFVVLSQGSTVPDVRDAIPGDDGRMWVLSSFEPHVTLLDDVGGVVVSFGSSGQGPGELRNPWYLAAHPEGIGVYDAGGRRLKVFDPAGELVREIATPEPGGPVLNDFRASNHGEPLRVHRFQSGWVFETYSGEVSSSGALWSGRLTYIPESQTGQDTLLTYDQLRSEPYQAGLQLFASAPLWTVCNDEYIAVLNPTDSVVTRLDTGGKAGSVKIPIALRPLTPDVVETWVDHRLELALSEENVEVDPATLAAIRQEALTEAMGAAAEVQPPTKILCDDEGRLWVQGFSVELDLQGYGREWAVFENEQLAASVTLPPRVWPLYLNRDDIIAVWKDDFDVERLVQLENPMKAHR